MTTLVVLTIAALILTSAGDVLEWLVNLPVEVFQGYSSLLRWVADSVQTLFEKYGYWVVFFGTFCENTLLVGLIVPGALVVILAGLAAHDGTIDVPYAIALGIAGTILGDTASYFLGRFGWYRLGRWTKLRELSEKVRGPLLQRGTSFVLFYHFAGYTRVIGPTAAGLLRMPLRKWAVADYLGAVIWVFAYFAAGYVLGIFGLSLESTEGWFRIIEYGLLVLVCLYFYLMLKAHTDLFEAFQEQPKGDEDTDEGEPDAERRTAGTRD